MQSSECAKHAADCSVLTRAETFSQFVHMYSSRVAHGAIAAALACHTMEGTVLPATGPTHEESGGVAKAWLDVPTSTEPAHDVCLQIRDGRGSGQPWGKPVAGAGQHAIRHKLAICDPHG